MRLRVSKMMTVQVAGVRFPGRTKDLNALEQMEARGFDGPFLKIIESASRACAFPEFSIGSFREPGWVFTSIKVGWRLIPASVLCIGADEKWWTAANPSRHLGRRAPPRCSQP